MYQLKYRYYYISCLWFSYLFVFLFV